MMYVTKIILFLSLRIIECYLSETDETYAVQRNFTVKKIKSDANTHEPQENLLNFLEANRLKGIAVAAYEGATVKIPCASRRILYVDNPIWFHSVSISNLAFRSMEEKETGVENGDLTIFYVRLSDAGVYQCKVGCFVGDLVVLDILGDEDGYNVVKPNSEQAHPSLATQITKNLISFTLWSVWSECSRCGVVGRRRRYGFCYIGDGIAREMTEVKNVSTTSDETNFHLTNVEKLLRAFPGGVSCQSRLLPQPVKYSLAASGRKNEIMMGLCKVPCTSDIFEVRTNSGEVLERANNSDGTYSLCQREPPQPPPLSRVIEFAATGTRMVIRCPGTTLRDLPVNWRLGVEEFAPRQMDRQTKGRIHLNARDHVVISDVRISDANIYSCWQRQHLAGVVKVTVYEDTRDKYGRRLILIGSLVCLCAALALTENVHSYQRRRYMRSKC